VAYAPGATVDLLFSVRNGGRVSVQVTAVRNALPVEAFSYEVREMPAGTTGYDEALAKPFRAFTLRRGESRTLVLHYTLKDCGPAVDWGGRMVERQHVRYRVFGRVSRSAEVPMGQPMVITGMPACTAG
jgi:hypothetical protein